jgi:hypothetical protein
MKRGHISLFDLEQVISIRNDAPQQCDPVQLSTFFGHPDQRTRRENVCFPNLTAPQLCLALRAEYARLRVKSADGQLQEQKQFYPKITPEIKISFFWFEVNATRLRGQPRRNEK